MALDEALARKIAKADGVLEYQSFGASQNQQKNSAGPLYIIQKNKVLFQNLKNTGQGQQIQGGSPPLKMKTGKGFQANGQSQYVNNHHQYQKRKDIQGNPMVMNKQLMMATTSNMMKAMNNQNNR